MTLFQNHEKLKLITWMSLTKSRNVKFPQVCHLQNHETWTSEMSVCSTVCMAFCLGGGLTMYHWLWQLQLYSFKPQLCIWWLSPNYEKSDRQLLLAVLFHASTISVAIKCIFIYIYCLLIWYFCNMGTD